MRERRLNPILGIIIIIVGGCAIGIILSMLINDGQNANNNVHISPTPTQAIGENIQSTPSPTSPPTVAPTSEPTVSPTPSPTPTPLPTASKSKEDCINYKHCWKSFRLQHFIDLANKTEINSW